jgi:hypothetical protein
LDPVQESALPTEKSEINIDDTVLSNNQVNIRDSLYNGKQLISIASTGTFTFSLPQTPEISSYTTSNAALSYETDSVDAYGTITNIEIKDKGTNYYSVPGISSIVTGIGSGAILEASSTNIGKISRTKINDIMTVYVNYGIEAARSAIIYELIEKKGYELITKLYI